MMLQRSVIQVIAYDIFSKTISNYVYQDGELLHHVTE